MRAVWIVVLTVTAAACAAPEDPVLRPPVHIDVELRRFGDYDSGWVSVVEPDRLGACNQVPFAHPGECDVTSDGWGCSEWPGAWLREVRIVRDGAVIASGELLEPWGIGIDAGGADLGGAVLVIRDVDGREIEVELPSVERPVPVIDQVVRTPVDISRDQFDIAWSTTPPSASAVVQLGGGFGGPRCHDLGANGVTSHLFGNSSAFLEAYVTAYAPSVELTTELGTVHVWAGAGMSRDLLAE